jgi:insertion element IS1 protein InsB
MLILKKHLALDGVERETKNLSVFNLEHEKQSTLKDFRKKIAHIDAEIYATDGWESYDLIDPAKHVIGKAHTFTVERTNRLLRHYIARFARKSYSVSKSFSMISNSILLFAYLKSLEYIHI